MKRSITLNVNGAARTAISSDGSDANETQNWVYLFSQGGADMRDLLGGKGAGIAEMMRIGLPAPYETES